VDWAWLVVIGAYALGTFPSAQLVGRLVDHDPTTEGSGNPGASNMLRVAGKSAGAAVLVLDTLKGAVATLVGLGLDGRPLAAACGVAAVLGHILPIGRGRRGGKGVATFGGVGLVMWPFVSLGALALWIVLVRLTKKPSIGSLVGIVFIVAGVWTTGRDGWEIALAAGLVAVIVIRHAGNIRRLFGRSEKAVGPS